MFLKVDNNENEPNMKARMIVETKYVLKKPTYSCISLIFARNNFNKSNAIFIGNNILYRGGLIARQDNTRRDKTFIIIIP